MKYKKAYILKFFLRMKVKGMEWKWMNFAFKTFTPLLGWNITLLLSFSLLLFPLLHFYFLLNFFFKHSVSVTTYYYWRKRLWKTFYVFDWDNFCNGLKLDKAKWVSYYKGAFGILSWITMGMSLIVVVGPLPMKDPYLALLMYMEYELYLSFITIVVSPSS